MSDPSRSQIESAWAIWYKILNQARLYGNITASTNLLTLLDTATQNARGDYIDEIGNVLQSFRANASGLVAGGTAAAGARVWLKQYCKSVIGRLNVDSASDADLWEELYRYMIDNNLRVDSRRLNYGNASQNIGTGTVQIVRLTRDDFNFFIESGFADNKRITCISDQNTGSSQGNETWQVVGQARARDELQRSGSGFVSTFAGMTPDDSLLTNPAFRTFGGTAGATAPTSLSGWTSDISYNSTNFGIDQTNVFRTIPSDGTPGSLVIKASTRLTQKLTVRGTDINRFRPHLMAIVWNRQVNSASGTLTARMGSIATSVAVSAQTGWQVTTVPSPIGQAAWYRNFYQNDMQVEVQWAQTGGTGLLLAEVLFLPAYFFDSLWYWILPSSTAAWSAPKVKDEFLIIDSEPLTGGVNQRWNARAALGLGVAQHGGMLPHSSGSSITWADA